MKNLIENREIIVVEKKLKDWCQTILPCDLHKVYGMIWEECLIIPTRLNNWRYGKSRIPLWAKRDLNKVALRYSGKKIFDEVGPEVVPAEA